MFKVKNKRPSTATVTSELCAAMKNRRRVKCVYGEGAVRTIEPYCHGHSREGHELLSAYQVAGPTESGWKLFDVTKLIDVRLTDEPFPTRADYNADEPGVTYIHCRH